MEQVSKGVQLKKCDTVEKTGLDVLQKREGITKNTESDTPNVEVKNDLFAEMKKVQLRKVNK